MMLISKSIFIQDIISKNSEGNPIIDAQYTTWISSGVNAKYKAMLLQQMKSKEFYITETVICQILHMYSI